MHKFSPSFQAIFLLMRQKFILVLQDQHQIKNYLLLIADWQNCKKVSNIKKSKLGILFRNHIKLCLSTIQN